jgi:hypothetical protein
VASRDNHSEASEDACGAAQQEPSRICCLLSQDTRVCNVRLEDGFYHNYTSAANSSCDLITTVAGNDPACGQQYSFVPALVPKLLQLEPICPRGTAQYDQHKAGALQAGEEAQPRTGRSSDDRVILGPELFNGKRGSRQVLVDRRVNDEAPVSALDRGS